MIAMTTIGNNSKTNITYLRELDIGREKQKTLAEFLYLQKVIEFSTRFFHYHSVFSLFTITTSVLQYSLTVGVA